MSDSTTDPQASPRPEPPTDPPPSDPSRASSRTGLRFSLPHLAIGFAFLIGALLPFLMDVQVISQAISAFFSWLFPAEGLPPPNTDTQGIVDRADTARGIFIIFLSLGIVLVYTGLFETDLSTDGKIPFLGGNFVIRAGGAIVMLVVLIVLGFMFAPNWSEDKDSLTLANIRDQLEEVLAAERILISYDNMFLDYTPPLMIDTVVRTTDDPALGIADLESESGAGSTLLGGRWVLADDELVDESRVSLPPARQDDRPGKVYFFDDATLDLEGGRRPSGTDSLLMAYVRFNPDPVQPELSISLYLNETRLVEFLQGDRSVRDASASPESVEVANEGAKP